ncbi:aspartate/glutamate racemase family protein [Psychroserpens jangbogonensis]|uniref:aspartate/glutamate racemase family protein n=1 Tax=Psychroserpens jangbogonensis TaxID=1484460 RepID=UPI00053E863D|nr:aspartate/glutamate racemase family protein [Psychroserpens jangbogonensis]
MAKQSKQTCILGLGERSTQYYVNTLHNKFHEKLGDFHTFPFLMYQIDFNLINPFLPNQFDKLIPELTNTLNEISKFEVEQYLIPNITLHETLDKIAHNLNIVHPIQLTIAYCKANDINTIVLFGSQYTMTSNYISDALKAEGINTKRPTAEEQIDIDNFRKKVYNNSDLDSDFRNYQNLIQLYSKDYLVVTACTELSLCHNQLDHPKVIDMALLQIQQVLK